MKLKLNSEKTESIIIGDRQTRESLRQNFPIQRLGNSLSPTDIVKNLGVTFHSGNTFTSHIAKVCHACYYHLKDLKRTRKFLSVETAALLANSMISSRLDHCNSLLYGISKYKDAGACLLPTTELNLRTAMGVEICKLFFYHPHLQTGCKDVYRSV